VYSILVAVGVGVAAGAIWTLLGLWKTWAMGIVLFFLVSVVTFVLVSRRTAKKVEPAFQQIQKQIEGGNVKLALAGLEGMLPVAKWQLLLKGQLHAQIGSLYFTIGDETRALESLNKASRRAADGQHFLASIHYRRKEVAKAREVLETAIRFNKKQMILYNVYAYILMKNGEKSEAIEQLMRGLKVEKENEATKDNLQRLQNGKRMNMKKFGPAWYSLQLEKLPAALRQGQGMAARKGFRQKPRKRR
jgi:tetratricopeptide (TPR) repeat protein